MMNPAGRSPLARAPSGPQLEVEIAVLSPATGARMADNAPKYASILLVEDNPDHAVLAKLSLSRLDEIREVRLAMDGVEALEILESSPLPDLILLDLRLPRLDGFELLERLRRDERFRKIPVIVLTTSAARVDLQRSRSLGAIGYLTKPLDGSALRRFMKRLADQEDGWSGQQELPF